MKQISFKLPDSEVLFLKWWGEKNAEPISGIYRNATLESFRSWKTNVLLKEYGQGRIGFKQFCALGNLTFPEASRLIEQLKVEPAISEEMDNYTNQISEKITSEDLFRAGSMPDRRSFGGIQSDNSEREEREQDT